MHLSKPQVFPGGCEDDLESSQVVSRARGACPSPSQVPCGTGAVVFLPRGPLVRGWKSLPWFGGLAPQDILLQEQTCAGKGRGFLPRWERVQTWGRRWCHPATLSVAELLQLYGAESNSNASTRHCSSVTSEAGGNVGNFGPICRSKFITSLVRRPRSTASVIVFSLLRWCG